MNLDITYVPTSRERSRAVVRAWFVWLLYAGLAGAVFAVFGIGSLARAAARHGEATVVASLAAVGGALLLFLPLIINLRSLRVGRQDQAERHINLTTARIRVDVQGVAIEAAWDKITDFRETPHQWVFRARNICLVLPKRAVPPERIAQIENFLRVTL